MQKLHVRAEPHMCKLQDAISNRQQRFQTKTKTHKESHKHNSHKHSLFSSHLFGGRVLFVRALQKHLLLGELLL
jgi:hypothetical protein